MGNPLSVNYPAWGLDCFKLPQASPAAAGLGGSRGGHGRREGGAGKLLMTHSAAAGLAKCSERSPWAQVQSDTSDVQGEREHYGIPIRKEHGAL